MKAFLSLLIWLGVFQSAFADDVIHFVALAVVAPENTAKYNAFVQAVEPIWNRHGMTVVARTQFSDQTAKLEPVSDITIIRVENRAGFRAYIADPDYAAIKDLRLQAVNALTIFDGSTTDASSALSKSEYLKVRFVTEPDESSDVESALEIRISSVTDVVATSPGFAKRTKSIRLVPVSNPPDQKPFEHSNNDYVRTGRRLR